VWTTTEYLPNLVPVGRKTYSVAKKCYMQNFNCKKCRDRWIALKFYDYCDDEEKVPVHFKLLGHNDRKNDKPLLTYKGDLSHLYVDIAHPKKTVVEEELLELIEFIPKSVTNIITLRKIGIVPGLMR
jgi:hypothetical protein